MQLGEQLNKGPSYPKTILKNCLFSLCIPTQLQGIPSRIGLDGITLSYEHNSHYIFLTHTQALFFVVVVFALVSIHSLFLHLVASFSV